MVVYANVDWQSEVTSSQAEPKAKRAKAKVNKQAKIVVPTMPPPDYQEITERIGVTRDTLFLDDMLAVINSATSTGKCNDCTALIAKQFAVSVGLEFAYNVGASIKGKLTPSWSVCRPKFLAVTVAMVASATEDSDEANSAPDAIGERLLNQLSSDDSSGIPDWKLVLTMDPSLVETVKDLVQGSDSEPLGSYKIYKEIMVAMYATLGAEKHTAASLIQTIYLACRNRISDDAMDFASSVVEDVAMGGGFASELVDIFGEQKYANMVSTARFRCFAHTMLAYLASSDDHSPDVASLLEVMTKIVADPHLLNRFACCDAVSCGAERERDVFTHTLTNVVQDGQWSSADRITSMLTTVEIALGLDDDGPQPLVPPHASKAPPVVKQEQSADSKKSDAESAKLSVDHRWMSLLEVMSLDSCPPADNIGDVHTFALQLENFIFLHCIGEFATSDVLGRLGLDLIGKKNIRLRLPRLDVKIYFMGTVTYGKKPKAIS